jgi:hypothetical protein
MYLSLIFKLVVYTSIICYLRMKMLLFWKENGTLTSSLTDRPCLQYGCADGPPAVRHNALCVCLNASLCALNANAGLDTPVQAQRRIFERLLIGT